MSSRNVYTYLTLIIISLGIAVLIPLFLTNWKSSRNTGHANTQKSNFRYEKEDNDESIHAFNEIALTHNDATNTPAQSGNNKAHNSVVELYSQIMECKDMVSMNRYVDNIVKILNASDSDPTDCLDLYYRIKSDIRSNRNVKSAINGNYNSITAHDINSLHGRIYYLYEHIYNVAIPVPISEEDYTRINNYILRSVDTAINHIEFIISAGKAELPDRYEERMALAEAEDTNPTVLYKLAQQGDRALKLQILDNPNVSKETIYALMKDPDRFINQTADSRMWLYNKKHSRTVSELVEDYKQ